MDSIILPFSISVHIVANVAPEEVEYVKSRGGPRSDMPNPKT